MASARAQLIAGNWKMNYGPKEATNFATEILPKLAQVMGNDNNMLCILCPPAISLSAVRDVMNGLQPSLPGTIELGAQNMYFEERGAFTGEISPSMLHELCSSVILGHSERRMYFGETDELVNKKVQAALQNNLRPIVCIGENQEQHESGQTEQVIRTQVQRSLSNLPKEQASKVVIAYEPIWAIGSGKAATGQDAGKVAQLIRQLYGSMYGKDESEAIHVLYGGSVTSENINDCMSSSTMDGALVGGASIKPDFVEIVRKRVGIMG